MLRFPRRLIVNSSKYNKNIPKPKSKKRLLVIQLCVDICIDINVCLITNSFYTNNNLSRQLCIGIQNDIILTSTSSIINNFMKRFFVYFGTSIISSITTGLIFHDFDLMVTIVLALSTALVSNIRYSLVNILEVYVSNHTDINLLLFSLILRIVNNTLGSLQYIYTMSLLS